MVYKVISYQIIRNLYIACYAISVSLQSVWEICLSSYINPVETKGTTHEYDEAQAAGPLLLSGCGVCPTHQELPRLWTVIVKLFRMCVNGKLSLKVLQEYILVKLNKQAVRSGLLFEVKGKIKPLGDSIGQLSAKFSE